jgi:hypothetical protein
MYVYFIAKKIIIKKNKNKFTHDRMKRIDDLFFLLNDTGENKKMRLLNEIITLV